MGRLGVMMADTTWTVTVYYFDRTPTEKTCTDRDHAARYAKTMIGLERVHSVYAKQDQAG